MGLKTRPAPDPIVKQPSLGQRQGGEQRPGKPGRGTPMPKGAPGVPSRLSRGRQCDRSVRVPHLPGVTRTTWELTPPPALSKAGEHPRNVNSGHWKPQTWQSLPGRCCQGHAGGMRRPRKKQVPGQLVWPPCPGTRVPFCVPHFRWARADTEAEPHEWPGTALGRKADVSQ